MSSNYATYLATTLDGHKKIVELFNQMAQTQIKDAEDIGIYYLVLNVNPIQFKTLCTTINDLFGPMVSAINTFYYCNIGSNQKNLKLIATIILSHAYALFNPYMSYDHWPKNAVSEYLEYFEKIILS